jgi:hypothetical protein
MQWLTGIGEVWTNVGDLRPKEIQDGETRAK